MRMERVLVIAEAGVNHNGSLAMALDLVDAAAEAGADIVKFQTFQADRLASRAAPKAEYQERTTGGGESQLDMLRRLELSPAMHDALIVRCAERGIRFLSTPFDFGSLDLLVSRYDMPVIKLGSGELTNAPLLLAAARTGRGVILSTGMSTLAEVEQALGVLAFGYCQDGPAPSRAAFEAAYGDPECRAILGARVTLLHCTTEYPAPFAEVNLRAMDTLRAAFGLPVGYSDHTVGTAIPIAAVARGATVIEKHFTLDRTLPGPDHKASLEPAELATMVTAIRQVEAALGDGIKMPAASERKNMVVARKSLVAARAIAVGELLDDTAVAVMRPGNGRAPIALWDTLGSVAKRDYAEGECFEP